MTRELAIECHGHVSKISFNRPTKKNALTRTMFRGMIEAIREADDDRSVNAILLCGSSGTFTAGSDIHDFLNEVSEGPNIAAFDFIRTMVLCDTPIVAAVEELPQGSARRCCFIAISSMLHLARVRYALRRFGTRAGRLLDLSVATPRWNGESGGTPALGGEIRIRGGGALRNCKCGGAVGFAVFPRAETSRAARDQAPRCAARGAPADARRP